MNSEYLNIYNNLIKLTRNKNLYFNTNSDENFSVRLIFYLLHFAFFLKIFKTNDNKKIMQEIYDYNFRQIEIAIREIGYGDVSINKKMKDYLNLFHKIILDINDWEKISIEKKMFFFKNYLNDKCNTKFYIDYFDKYAENLKKNTLNSFINNILELKI